MRRMDGPAKIGYSSGMTIIKNCGLKTVEAIDQAAKTGASLVGFVHHAASPRHLDLSQLAALSGATPHNLHQVVVMVDPSDAILANVLGVMRPHFWQIHRVDAPERVAAIAALTGIPVIAAINVRGHDALANVHDLEDVSAHLLFDAYHPQEQGGTGQMFDWSLLQAIRLRKPWFLAGGLTSENAADAIRRTKAPMVDVSSGIEDAPGVKSLEKIAAFNAAVLQASPN